MSACEQCGWDSEARPKRRWTAEIEYSYPSVNQLGANTKNGWSYRKIRNALTSLLKDQLNAIPAANRHRTGIITRMYGKGRRAYDEENLIGGGKPLIDVLRDYAVIIDDKPSCWKGYYHQEKSVDGVDRIRIELLEF